MKSTPSHIKHVTSLLLLLIVSGFAFSSFEPNSGHVELPANAAPGSGQGRHMTDSGLSYPNDLFALVFAESTDQNEPLSGMNGTVVLKQGITAIESAFLTLSLDTSFFFKRKWQVFAEAAFPLLYGTNHHPSIRFRSFASSIAINAP